MREIGIKELPVFTVEDEKEIGIVEQMQSIFNVFLDKAADEGVEFTQEELELTVKKLTAIDELLTKGSPGSGHWGADIKDDPDQVIAEASELADTSTPAKGHKEAAAAHKKAHDLHKRVATKCEGIANDLHKEAAKAHLKACSTHTSAADKPDEELTKCAKSDSIVATTMSKAAFIASKNIKSFKAEDPVGEQAPIGEPVLNIKVPQPEAGVVVLKGKELGLRIDLPEVCRLSILKDL
jgi:hypothetical protein